MRFVRFAPTAVLLSGILVAGASRPAQAQYFDGFSDSYPQSYRYQGYGSGSYGYGSGTYGYGSGGYGYGSSPLNVIIHPRRPAAVPAWRPKANAVVPVPSAVPAASDSKPRSFVRINPETHPDWYLKDTTLRWGDIVVLKSGPVVFEGQTGPTAHRPEAFVSLDRTKTLSRAGQHEIRQMAAGVYAPP